MADLATLGLYVDASGAVRALGQFGRATEQATKAAGGATRQMDSMRQTIRDLAVAFGAFQAARWASETITLGARYETLGVVMGIVGNNAGKTRAEMDALQTSLQETGISMIESRQNLARMASAQINLANATGLARIAQDAAVIANENSSASFERLITGITTGQTRILRTLGIYVDFDRALQAGAESMGKTKEALTEVESVQIRANAVMAAGAQIAGAYAAAMDTAGKQVRSAERYLEDARVKVSEAFQPAYTTLVFAYADALKIIGNNASRVSALMAALAAATAAALAVWAVYRTALIAAATLRGILALAAAIRKAADAMAILQIVGKGAVGAIAAIAALTVGWVAYQKVLEAVNRESKKWIDDFSRVPVVPAAGVSREVRFANEDRIREASQEVELAKEHLRLLAGATTQRIAVAEQLEIMQIRQDEINESIKARRELQGEELYQTLNAIAGQARLKEEAAKYRYELERIVTLHERIADALSKAHRISAALTGRDSPLARGFAGAQGGFELAGILPGISPAAQIGGAVFGGVLAGIGAVIQRGKEWEEALRRLQAAIEDFSSVFSSDLANAIRAVRNEAAGLREAAEEQFPGLFARHERAEALEAINRLEAERITLLRAQAEELERQRDADLRIRFVTATGTTREAEDARFAEEQRRERRETLAAVRNLGDLLAYGQLLQVQAAERAAREAQFQREQQEFREDLEVRRLRATGLDAEADALAFALQQQREYAEAVRAGADAATLAALAETQRVEAIAFATQEIENTIAGLTTTIDRLRDFQRSLRLDPQLSGLSPVEQLRVAREAYARTVNQALAGDAAAAERIPELARQFLEISRLINASGGRYQVDFGQVLRDTEAIAQLFEGQRTEQQQILDELRGIREVEIDVGDRRRQWQDEDLRRRDVEQQEQQRQHEEGLEKLQAVVAILEDGFTALEQAQDTLRLTVADTNAKTTRVLEGLQLTG